MLVRMLWCLLRVSMAAGAVLLISASASAQIQQGSITGTVVQPDGQPAENAVITLLDALGSRLAEVTATRGVFTLTGVGPGSYTLRAEAPPLEATVQHVTVQGAIPVQVRMQLVAVARDAVVVRGEGEIGSTGTRVTLSGETIRRAPSRIPARGLQDAIATLPGWSTEDNGLLHVRGVDDGFLYVVDGVPVYERLDGLFGIAPDPAMVESMNVFTGYIPAEFGWKSGSVIEVRSATRTADRWSGALDLLAGADSTTDASLVSGGPLGRSVSVTVGGTRQSSSRFLDPVHPDNLHNDGAGWNGGGQLSYGVSSGQMLNLLAGANRSIFDVPHGETQEAAGQDQRQKTAQSWQTLSWQRSWSAATVSQLAGYHRSGSARLTGSEGDVPLFTGADRELRRVGLLGSVSHQRGRHLLKAGFESAWLRLREDFTFAVTDADAAEDAGLSDEAIGYTRDHPFHFAGAVSRPLFAVYVQDSIRVSGAVTLDAGIRADWSRLLERASQVSPRIGAAYRWDATQTTIRASAGRFFQPPQPENLLLASSDQAWKLSPFRSETDGGAVLKPERQTAFEAGAEQPLGGRVRLDAAVWHRRMTDVADPNVFFGTTVLFPNAVAKGRASGFDVRLEMPRRSGWAGYLSYTNSRVTQYGPISGGLFLEDEVIEIGPGTAFTPDHDQRHAGAFGLSFDAERQGFWTAFTGRYESGTPLEVDEDELDELRERPGSDLVDLDRGRVKPRTVLDLAASTRLVSGRGFSITVRASLLNLAGARWAYNFGNPFSGTHFGPGRTLQVALRVETR